MFNLSGKTDPTDIKQGRLVLNVPLFPLRERCWILDNSTGEISRRDEDFFWDLFCVSFFSKYCVIPTPLKKIFFVVGTPYLEKRASLSVV